MKRVGGSESDDSLRAARRAIVAGRVEAGRFALIDEE
jgi:hypothetical protein